ncbi:hypothetical protein GCM10010413_46900 [Promicromonospora sukumoe]
MSGLVEVDAAQQLYTEGGEQQEHDRQDTLGLSPGFGEERAGGTCQGHGEPKSNGMDTEPGNTT